VLFFGRIGRFPIGPEDEARDAVLLVRQSSAAALADSRLLPLTEAGW
jgi:hypothetical protein